MPRGFTLAELLIALAILGIIATFTIPKVLQSQQADQKKAVFRETLATISQIVYTGVKTGEIRTNARLYWLDHANAVKICPTDVVAEGCWGSPTYLTYTDDDGILFHNGASIVDLDFNGCAGASCQDVIDVDWNGPLPPNVQGDDRMLIQVYYGTAPGAGNEAGRLNPGGGIDGVSDTLYESVFK